MNELENLKNSIREIPDFPRKGIRFKDITPILADYVLSEFVIQSIASKLKNQNIDAIACIESRGFFFAMSIAQTLGIGIIPVRKERRCRPIV